MRFVEHSSPAASPLGEQLPDHGVPMVSMTLDPDSPPAVSAEELAAIDALTPEEIEENARTDPDNPPMTEDELACVRVARFVQLTRHATGLTQTEFAERYRFDPEQLERWERGRQKPDAAILAYLQTIRFEPEAVSRALTAPAAA